jgi:hypothetical protein
MTLTADLCGFQVVDSFCQPAKGFAFITMVRPPLVFFVFSSNF